MHIYFSNYSTCLLILFVLIMFLGRASLGKKLKLYFFVSVMSLTVLAFLFDPMQAWRVNGNYTDLFRYFVDMDAFTNYGWNGNSSLFKTSYSYIPIIKVLVYLVAKSKIYGLLPAISALAVYGMSSKFILEFRKDTSADGTICINTFLIILFVTNYKVTITNIRMPIGAVFFFWLLYNDCIKQTNKKLCFIGYILLCGIHSIFVVFLILRVISIFVDKYNKFTIAVIMVLSESALTYIIYNWLSVFSNNAYISAILGKINFYTSDQIVEYREPAIVILGILKVVCTIILMRATCKKTDKILWKKYTPIFNFTFIFLSFCVGSFWNYHLFHRMTNFVIYLIAFWYLTYEIKIKNTDTYSPRFAGKRKSLVATRVEWITYGIVVLHFLYFFLSYQYRVLCF